MQTRLKETNNDTDACSLPDTWRHFVRHRHIRLLPESPQPHHSVDVHRAYSAFGQHELSGVRSEEHTTELQSLMCKWYAVFCLTKKQTNKHTIYVTFNINK